MLTQQGLNQYRALNFGLAADRNARGWEDLGRKTAQGDARIQQGDERMANTEKWRGGLESTRVGLAASTQTIQNLSKQREDINRQVVAGIITPEKAAPQIQKLNDAIAGELAKINSLKVPQGEQAQGGGSGDEQQSIENAKEAIKVNPAAKDKILQKLRSVYPDANVGD